MELKSNGTAGDDHNDICLQLINNKTVDIKVKYFWFSTYMQLLSSGVIGILNLLTTGLTIGRINFFTACHLDCCVHGVYMSGSIVQLIIHGLPEVSSWST